MCLGGAAKKIGMATHTSTLVTFVFPYAQVGGAQGILELVPVEIEDYLLKLGLDKWIPSTRDMFCQQPTFTRTCHKMVLGCMNRFKTDITYCSKFS